MWGWGSVKKYGKTGVYACLQQAATSELLWMLGSSECLSWLGCSLEEAEETVKWQWCSLAVNLC